MFKLNQLAIAVFPLVLTITGACADTTLNHPMVLNTPGLSLVAKAKWIGSVDPNQQMNVTVWLNLRNRAKLEQLVRDIYNPNSPGYQKFVTSEELIHHYLPSHHAEKTVQDYFEALGMKANIVNHSVRIKATARQIEQALHVKINRYHFQNRIIYANAAAPTLNSEVGQYVSEITGLNDITLFHPMIGTRDIRQKDRVQQPHDFNLSWDSFIPSVQPTNNSLSGFTGARLQSAYNLADVQPVNGTAINGAGQTLVIIDGCGNNSAATIMNDANQYNTANAITVFSGSNFNVINPDGSAFTSCTGQLTGWEAEIALDVESSHTVAPASNTVLVLAANGGMSADLITAVNDVISTLTTNNPTHTLGGFANASVISNSWGATERSDEFNSLENSLLIAAASGLSFNFSTGDCGDDIDDGNTCLNSPFPEKTDHASVNYPASSTYVTAIGGTSLFVGSTWAYSFETGWGTYRNNFEGGAGGGISELYGPVTWQESISAFYAGGYDGTIGSHQTCGLGSNQTCRALPDISMLADWNTGLSIYFTGNNPNPDVYGGTSLSCPLFSGTLLLINQARALQGHTAIGHAAPYVYNQHAVLVQNKALNLVIPPHQIISGATPPPSGAPLSAFTLDGITFSWDSSLTIEPEFQFWNDVVGVGTPNVPNFVTQMASF